MIASQYTHRYVLLFFITLVLSKTNFATAAVAQSPLFLTTGVPPIVMLTMGRDHKLFYEAYNDASDLNGDGELDIHYKPDEINYFGYFDSHRCYSYASNKFSPVSITETKKCSNSWSGDFLNYITTSRMDALRKVLYGGYRSIDTADSTILTRAFIPQDAHSWGKEYTSVAVDGYDISDYAPLNSPTTGTRHLFANVSLSITGEPLMRVLKDSKYRIWEWVSIERPVAGEKCERGDRGPTCATGTSILTDYSVNVEVCTAVDTALREENCRAYADGDTITYKPAGILQRYGEEELMAFGLLTGSYKNNLAGGVLRKNISSFKDEINLETGVFKDDFSGIVDTIDKIRIASFRYDKNYTYASSWITTRPINNGEAQDWGNPIAEMMYEGLRYFAGKTSSTTVFSDGVGNAGTLDSTLGLPLPSWQNPYRTGGGYQYCAKPIQLVIGDINPSYDTDQLPGSSFSSSFSGDLTNMNVSALADTIWAGENEASKVFIGQSGTDSDGAPTEKAVTSFSNIRGLSPEEPTKLGGYYSGSVALYGQENDINSAPGKQNVDTVAVALASPLPRIEIPVSGKTVSLVPFAKSISSVNDCFGLASTSSSFRPTNQIVDFYVETIANTGAGNSNITINSGRPYGKFRINFEDVEQAADHDMDAIVEYEFSVNESNQVEISLNRTKGGSCIIQHIGYVISGTETDGTYLEVSNREPTDDKDYFLDTPPGELPDGTWNDGVALPVKTSRIFNVSMSDSSASFIKHDPLWYAAKWSKSKGKNGVLDTDEWDNDGDGTPDNYFLVTNAGNLETQLNTAFEDIFTQTSSASAAATNSTRLNSGSKIYQARFNSIDWSGELLAYDLDDKGEITGDSQNAADYIPSSENRNIFTYNPDTGSGIEFKYDVDILSTSQIAYLNTDGFGSTDTLGSDRLNYIRGDHSREQSKDNGIFRNRSSLLGDIVHSDPLYVGLEDNYGYSLLPSDKGGSSYIAYRRNKLSTTATLYFGANDGMLHAINAESGEELFTYVPDTVFSNLSKLTSPEYGCSNSGCINHSYFVDGSPKAGDVYINTSGGSTPSWHTVLVGTLAGGGKGLFALDITDSTEFSASKVLWEMSTTHTPVADDLVSRGSNKFAVADNLGYTFSEASIVRMHNGKWAAIIGNGYESASRKAVLYIIDIETGEVLSELDTKVGGTDSPNGMATPIPVDYDGDRITDAIYAGDLQGNLWKIDVSGGKTEWDFAFKSSGKPAPLFAAKDADGAVQPITAKPQVSRHPDGGVMVFFGTGKYFEVNDQVVGESPQIQTFYAIRDAGSQIASRSDLQEQTILAELTIASLDLDVRATSETIVDYTSKKGWYMDLKSPVNGAEGERVVTEALLRAGRVIFVTLIPNTDPCAGGGSSWFMELDAINGKRLERAPFDVNGDGYINEADLRAIYDIDGDDDVDDDDKTQMSGIRFHNQGIMNKPSVLSDGQQEQKYLPGSNGDLKKLTESAGDPVGRQSWRQLQ